MFAHYYGAPHRRGSHFPVPPFHDTYSPPMLSGSSIVNHTEAQRNDFWPHSVPLPPSASIPEPFEPLNPEALKRLKLSYMEPPPLDSVPPEWLKWELAARTPLTSTTTYASINRKQSCLRAASTPTNRQDSPTVTPTAVNRYLAAGSPGLVAFDLRLPHSYVRKSVKGFLTPLKHDDLREPACQPTRERMRLYVAGSPDCTIEVRPRARSYVTIEDILYALHHTLHKSVDRDRWTRDKRDKNTASRVLTAYSRRCKEAAKYGMFDETNKGGLKKIDYLGQCHSFAGLNLAYGQGDSEWWMVEVEQQPS